jgi:hypothetical protein
VLHSFSSIEAESNSANFFITLFRRSRLVVSDYGHPLWRQTGSTHCSPHSLHPYRHSMVITITAGTITATKAGIHTNEIIKSNQGPMLWIFNIFAKKFSTKHWRFWQKRQFFRRKLSNIAENCDHNIDPSFTNNAGANAGSLVVHLFFYTLYAKTPRLPLTKTMCCRFRAGHIHNIYFLT